MDSVRSMTEVTHCWLHPTNLGSKTAVVIRNFLFYSARRSFSLLSENIKIKINRNIILPLVLYGCKTWSLTLREECMLRVFDNRVLRRIFGPTNDEVTEDCRRLHNEQLYALYSPNIIRVIKSKILRWAVHVIRVGESRGAYRVLVGKPEGRRPLGRPRRRWAHIKIDLREVEWGHGLDRSC